MKPWDDATVLAKKGVSLTVLQHWAPGKERLLTAELKVGDLRVRESKSYQNKIQSFGTPTLGGQLSCTYTLPSKHCCSCNPTKLRRNWIEELPWVTPAPDGWTPRVIHKGMRCHSGPLMQMHPSCTASSYMGKQPKPVCMAGSGIIFLEICPFSPVYRSQPVPPSSLSPLWRSWVSAQQQRDGLQCGQKVPMEGKGYQRMKLCLLKEETQERKRKNW